MIPGTNMFTHNESRRSICSKIEISNTTQLCNDLNLNAPIHRKLPQQLSSSYNLSSSTTKTFIRDRDCKNSKEKTNKDISQDSLNSSLTENCVYERHGEYNHCELQHHSYISYKVNNQFNNLYTHDSHSSIEKNGFEFPIADTPCEL